MSLASATDLAALLRQYRLLEPNQLDDLPKLQAQFPEARALVRELVQRGWLTPYQANQVFLGRGPELLLGSYVLLERLGEGGMGAVFKARNWKLGRTVALKVIRKERLVNPDVVHRFYREVQAAAKLDHPNVCRADDADQVGDVHFFAMEYIDGRDLGKVVRQHGPLPAAAACDYIRQAALGLQHAFEKGLVHRDIKPANLLLTSPKPPHPPAPSPTKGRGGEKQDTNPAGSSSSLPPLPSVGEGGRGGEGVVKLLDLGLALVQRQTEEEDPTTQLTREGVVMGTPDFMAPEQTLDSHTVDVRADLYSLGCTLYYLLTARVPFPGGSLGQKLMRHQMREPQSLAELRPDLPPSVVAVVRKLMAKRPEDRFQTPAELATALEQVAAGGDGLESVALPPPPEPVRADTAEVWAAVLTPQPAQTPTSEQPPHRTAEARQLWRWLALGSTVLLAGVGLLVLLLLRSGPAATPEEATPAPKPPALAPVEAECQALEEKFAGPEPGKLRPALLQFVRHNPGTPQALRIAALFRRLPSPLDQLDGTTIPESERFDWQPKELVAVLGEHRARFTGVALAVAFRPDGRPLCYDNQGHPHCWDAHTLQPQEERSDPVRWGRRAVLSRDGRLALMSLGVAAPVQLHDLETAKVAPLGIAASWWGVAFSADGKQALAGGDRDVFWWDVQAKNELGRLQGHTKPVLCVAFLPDGRRALTGSNDGTVRLWDLPAGKELHKFEGLWGAVHALDVSADGKQALAGTNDGTLIQCDLEAGKEIRHVKIAAHAISTVALTPDGKRALFGTETGLLRLWDVQAGKILRPLVGPLGGVTALAVSGDGRRALSASGDRCVRVWDLDGRAHLGPDQERGHVGQVFAVAFAPDGATLASGALDGRVFLWDLGQGGPKVRALLPKLRLGAIRSLAFSPDGRLLACGGQTGDVVLVQVSDTGLQPRPAWTGHTAPVRSLCFSPDGGTLASGGGDGSVRLWDVAGNKERARLVEKGPEVGSVGFSPDGRLLAWGGNDGRVRVCTLGQGDVTRALPQGEWPVEEVAFAPDGKTLAAVRQDGQVQVYDPVTGREVAGFGADRNGSALAFAPDGKTLAVSSPLGSVAWWQADGKKRLASWRLPGHVAQMAFAPDGRHLATANGNGTVYILRLGESSGAAP
jgi:WD40 repeat protein/serine/threonine protein kinase